MEPATRQNFRLKTGAHSAIVAIVKPIKGPQGRQRGNLPDLEFLFALILMNICFEIEIFFLNSGNQDIVLELLMEMYNMGRFQASAAANINIFVTPYDF